MKPYKCQCWSEGRARLVGVTIATRPLFPSQCAAATAFRVSRYSPFIDRLLKRSEVLSRLQPKEPLFWALSDEFRSMDDAAVADGREVKDSAHLALVRGAILYALDELDQAHRVFQEDHTSLGSYWHGMMHRREGDFDNARYWFRRAGRLATFHTMHAGARSASPTMARQETWDPYLLSGQCEQVRFGATELIPECQKLLRVEFDPLLAYSWDRAVGELQPSS